MLACVIFITSNVNLVFAADAENYSFEAEPFVNLPEISPEGLVDDRIPEENMLRAGAGTRHLLNVSTCVQETGYYCGPASVQQLLNYLGYNYTQDNLATLLGTQPSVGTNFYNIAKVLNKIVFGLDAPPTSGQPGYRSYLILDPSINSSDAIEFISFVKQDTKYNDPMIYNVSLSVLYPGSSGGHFVTGCGWREGTDGSFQSCYYVDPWYAVQDATYAGLKIVSLSEMLQAISYSPQRGYVW